MSIVVTILPKYQDNQVYKKYALMLSKALNKKGLSGYIGKFADFRNSAIARQSFIEKVHIRVPGQDPWDKKVRQPDRVADNFLVFCKHCLYDNYYQIIEIITPDGHARSNALIPYLSEMSEKHFHSLDIESLRKLVAF